MSFSAGSGFAASVADADKSPSCALLRVSGLGTASNPHRIASILRHADFADETEFSSRLAETERVLTGTHEALSQIQPSSSVPSAEILREVLEGANDQARTTDAYYSAIVAIKAHADLAAAQIGNVKFWISDEGDLRPQLEPTILSLPNQAGSAVLTGTLGLGFDPTKIQAATIKLESKGFALIGMETDAITQPGQFQDFNSPEELLHRLLAYLSNESPMVLVITN